MTNFVGGPADGVELLLPRSPQMLRVAIDELPESAWALHQTGDRPAPGERIYVYVLFRHRGRCPVTIPAHVGQNVRPEARRHREMDSTYHFCAIQPPDSVLRDEDAWNAWAAANVHLSHHQHATA